MVFQFAFRHMDSSEALQAYAEKKVSEKINKFVTKPIEAHMTFSVDKNVHNAHCSVVGGDGFNLQVEHSCGDMYGSVDMIVDKLEAQLKKHKEKLKGHKADKDEMRRFAEAAATAQEQDGFEPSSLDARDVVAFENAKKRAH